MSVNFRMREGFKWISEALSHEESNPPNTKGALSCYKVAIMELESLLSCTDAAEFERRILTGLSQAYDRVEFIEKKITYPNLHPSRSVSEPSSALARRKLYDNDLRVRKQSLNSSPVRCPNSPSLRKPPDATTRSELEVFILANKSKPSKDSSGFSSIAGLDSVKKSLQEAVILPSLRPDLFNGLLSPPRGILLFGPPGNGKTLLAKTLAAEGGMTLFSITASSLTSKYVGEGEKLMKTLFQLSLEFAPSLIFIDEVDSVLCRRKEGEHEASRRLKNEFFSSFDSLLSSQDRRVLLIAATNRPQELDDAAVRRLTKRMYVPMPDKHVRREVIDKLLAQSGSLISEDEFSRLSDKATKGYSCSDLTNLAKEAALGPLRELTPVELRHVNPRSIRKISIGDFEQALLKVRPSYGASSLKAYEEWNKRYGDAS